MNDFLYLVKAGGEWYYIPYGLPRNEAMKEGFETKDV